MATFTYPQSQATISGGATEAKQDTMITELQDINTELDTINSNTSDNATETTLATVKTDTASIVTNTSDNATETTLATVKTDTASIVTNTSDNATETTLATVKTDTATIAGDTTSLDGKVTACDTDNVTITSIPAITVNSLTPVDFFDSGRVDASSTAIPTSGLQVVASTAADIKEIEIIEDIGEYMLLTDGSDTLITNLPLGGGRIKVSISSGTTLKIASDTGSSITTGEISMNLLG